MPFPTKQQYLQNLDKDQQLRAAMSPDSKDVVGSTVDASPFFHQYAQEMHDQQIPMTLKDIIGLGAAKQGAMNPEEAQMIRQQLPTPEEQNLQELEHGEMHRGHTPIKELFESLRK